MKIGMSFPEYDAELNTDVCDRYNNAELTLTLRLGFKQINPAGGAAQGTYRDYGDATGTARKIIKWSPHSWGHWKKNFVRSARKFWHGRIWLVNDFSDYDFVDGGVTYRPNIWCRFELIGGDTTSGWYNHTIEVVRLHPSETWFGSHSRLYDSLDTKAVQKGTDSHGKPIMQRAHVHEVGHLLGLDHVDVGKAHCPSTGNTNKSPCYGVADVDKNSVMGEGMELRPKHGNPWRKSMVQLSGRGNARGTTDWQAKLKRHYPRTMAECARKAEIMHRPHRGLVDAHHK